jgi:hypothetical protein
MVLTVSNNHMSLQIPSLLRPPKASMRPSGSAVKLWHMRSHGHGVAADGSELAPAAAAAAAAGSCGNCCHLQWIEH